MAEPSDPPHAPEALPEPRVVKARRWNVSLVWLVPAVAVAIAASMLVRSVFLTGPRIEIEFKSAEGVEAGKTEVRYKEVVIGKVVGVALRDDRERVVVIVQLDQSAARFAVEDTAFWVVKPRIGTGGVSGLGTLLSGAYIGTDAGVSTRSRSEFVGLEQPPLVLRGEPGSIYVLRATDLGSLDVGSPVFHRRTPVGRVVGYTLDAERDELSLKIFVEAP
jgi:paraquat-inducible protein B